MGEPLLHLGMINDGVLMERYSIPNKNREYFLSDLVFIKRYRTQLIELFNTLARSVDNYQEEIFSARQQYKNICSQVMEFMIGADRGNLMRRVAFVDNIDTEIDEIVADVKRKNSDHDIKMVVEGEGKRLKDYLKYTASETLMFDDRFEKLEAELGDAYAGKLSKIVKDNFIELIDPNDLTKEDALFLIGYVVDRKEKVYESAGNFNRSHCDEGVCTRDDCMYPYVCSYISQKSSYSRSLSRYEECFNALKSWWEGTFDPRDADKVALKISNPTISEIVRKILSSKELPSGKKFAPTLTHEQWLLINEFMVRGALYKKIKDEEHPNLRNLDEIVAYIILNNMDFSLATGEKKSVNFIKEYIRLEDLVEKQPQEKDAYFLSYEQMKKIYEELIASLPRKEQGEE